MNAPVLKPPGRAVLRLAGVFTQVACAACLLLGTIAFVLIQQNNSDGTELAITWGVGAMVGLVCGGLMVRGGLISLLLSAVLDGAFGIVLLVIDEQSLAGMLRVLSAEDVTMIADALVGAAVGMLVVFSLCLLAIPQAIRYGRWLHASNSLEFVAAGSTERGFPPPPISAAMTGSMWRAPAAPPAERRSRRRMYIALAGFAIGFGAGIGVLVSSTTDSGSGGSTSGGSTSGGSTSTKAPEKNGSGGSGGGSGPIIARPTPDAGAGQGQGQGQGSSDSGSILAPKPTTTVQAMLQDQRVAIANGDIAGLVATIAPGAVGFGVNADDVAIGRAAIEAQIKRDLGTLSNATVEAPFGHTGIEQNHAWIAQQLTIIAPGRGKRTFTVTQLAAAVGGKWQVVAWKWGKQIPDGDAERAALLGTKPAPKIIANHLTGPKELDAAVRAAFGSRSGLADSRSERSDAFNFGSGPNERMQGGRMIKKVFAGSRFEIRLHDGAHVVAGGAWDPMQKTSPWIAYALVNVDYTERTKAATELTHTFRVLAVLLKEGSEWKIVQTQWSHGGPVR